MHDPVWQAREEYIAAHWQPIPLPCEREEELAKAQKRLETLKAKGFTGWRALLEERKIKAEKNVAEKKGKNQKAYLQKINKIITKTDNWGKK